ncbi:MAG: MBL fold metallo-hydrolase [Phycisphaerales bacterium]|nr:MAG: MBL fold metallo-hydrolase [Phycisphaerales bacterium]
MRTFSLQSGSNGNAIYVEANGTRLLFDAGISGRKARRRLADHNRTMDSVDALIISHDHSDHVRCAGIYQRHSGMPIYMTRRTHQAFWCDLGKLSDVRYFRSGDSLSFADMTVHTIPTQHDAADGVAFVVECEASRLGIFTDLGHPFTGLRGALESVDAAYLECNYDAEMLEAGPYPPQLKARIRGKGGHLSNDESAALLRGCGSKLPRWVAVAHLSEENNRPELAVDAQLRAIGNDYPVHLAPRESSSELLEV